MAKETNLTIKIPKDLVVFKRQCKQDNASKDYPLSFLTYDGTDAAAAKRKETASNWSKGYRDTKFLGEFPLTNEPLEGFKIPDQVSRWSTSNVAWRIEDPRGFTVEIYSGNLMNIIKQCTIENGVINAPCVWGRDGGNNVLIPTCSEEFKTAQKNTERVAKTVTEVPLGSKVVLKNGLKGIYLGFLRIFRFGSPDDGGKIFFEKKRRHLYMANGEIKAYSEIYATEILKAGTMTQEECVKEINERLQETDHSIYDGRGDRFYGVVAVLDTDKLPEYEIFTEEFFSLDAVVNHNSRISYQHLMIQYHGVEHLLVEYRSGWSSTPPNIYVNKILERTPTSIKIAKETRREEWRGFFNQPTREWEATVSGMIDNRAWPSCKFFKLRVRIAGFDQPLRRY